MIEGNDAHSGAAGEMGLEALVMGVVGRPAPLVRLIIWAFITVISRVLTMTLEAIEVRWQFVLA
jgi:hypothetical protein